MFSNLSVPQLLNLKTELIYEYFDTPLEKWDDLSDRIRAVSREIFRRQSRAQQPPSAPEQLSYRAVVMGASGQEGAPSLDKKMHVLQTRYEQLSADFQGGKMNTRRFDRRATALLRQMGDLRQSLLMQNALRQQPLEESKD